MLIINGQMFNYVEHIHIHVQVNLLDIIAIKLDSATSHEIEIALLKNRNELT